MEGTATTFTSRSEIRKLNGSKNSFGRFVNFAGNLIFGLILLIVALLSVSLIYLKLSGRQPELGGYRMYIVLSGSMHPAFDAGSMVFVKTADPSTIKSGDIITFKGQGESAQLVSHRVVSVDESDQGVTFTTQGDANDAADPNPVQGKNLVGKVTLAIPHLGYLMEYSRTRRGILFLVFIPAVLLFAYELISLGRAKKAKTSEEGESQGRFGNTQ